MSATGDRKRGSHARLSWRRRRAAAKLVLLEHPGENGQLGKPIEMAAPPRPIDRRGNRRAIAIAAGVVVATGSIAGGSMALASGRGSDGGGSPGGGSATAPRTPAPDRVVVMPDTGPVWTGLVSGPALRSAAASKANPSPSASLTVSPTPAASPGTTAAAPAVRVTYQVDNRSFDGFEADISVTNSGPSAVSDWHIVVALPEDHFESWWGASGDVTDGALILHPESSSGPLEPGETLHVHFKASGRETTPSVCTFNDVTCTTS